MRGVFVTPEHRLECPNCNTQAVKRITNPKPGVSSTEMHRCPGRNGVIAPLVVAGVRCTVEVVERGDYVNGELVQTDGNGRPIQAVVTTRDDGRDTAVLAPTARNDKES